MVESPGRDDRQLDVFFRDECRSRGNGPITTRNDNAPRTGLDRILDALFQLWRLNGFDLEPSLRQRFARGVSGSGGGVEVSFDWGSDGKGEGGGGRGTTGKVN